MRYNQILSEAQNYGEMFSSLYAFMVPDSDFTGLKQTISDDLRWAKRTLKKNDRVVWFLRIVRLYAAKIIKDYYFNQLQRQTDDPEFKIRVNMVGKLWRKMEEDTKRFNIGDLVDEDTRTLMRKINEWRESLQHYLSLPIQPIQDYVFTDQSPSKVFFDIRQYEKAWQQEQGQHISIDDQNDIDEVVMTFPDGMMWVDLGVSSCEREGESMGHCGNSAGQKHGDTILSLRKIVQKGDKKYWHPFLTFILHDDGNLGEMKGRGNEKPAARYHPYIVALLRSSLIQGIVGGGYMPQNNFSLEDLPEDEAESLMEEKPTLMTPKYLYITKGLTPETGEQIADWLNEEIYNTNFTYDPEENILITDDRIDYYHEDEKKKYFGDGELDDFDYKLKSDRDAFLELFKEQTGLEYKDIVDYYLEKLSPQQKKAFDKILTILKKDGYAPLRQPDLFGGPDKTLGVASDFIEMEAKNLEENTENSPAMKLSRFVGWRMIGERVNAYVKRIKEQFIPSSTFIKKVGNNEYLAIGAYELSDLLGDEVDPGYLAHSIGDGYYANDDFSWLQENLGFEIPYGGQPSYRQIKPEIVFDFFMKSFVGEDKVDVDDGETDEDYAARRLRGDG
jgi:hypothetical protein